MKWLRTLWAMVSDPSLRVEIAGGGLLALALVVPVHPLVRALAISAGYETLVDRSHVGSDVWGRVRDFAQRLVGIALVLVLWSLFVRPL